MKTLSKVQALKEAQKMWSWIAKNSIKENRKCTKQEYLTLHKIEDSLMNNCYFCEYDRQHTRDNRDSCRNCPLTEWRKEGSKLSVACAESNTPFAKIQKAETVEEYALYANDIANLCKAELDYIDVIKQRKALEETIDMWQWLLDMSVGYKVSMTKEDYLVIVKGVQPVDVVNKCYLCDYTAEKLCTPYSNCYYCPVKNWYKGQDPEELKTPCEDSESPYYIWRMSFNREIKEKAIMDVIKLCRDALRDLED